MADIPPLLTQVLQAASNQGAAEVHLSPGHYARLRVDRRMVNLEELGVLDDASCAAIGVALTGQPLSSSEVQTVYEREDGARFRVIIFRTRNVTALHIQVLGQTVPSLADLHMPPALHAFGQFASGLVIIASPHGHGRITTWASVMDTINHERSEQIMTFEQPIELVLQSDKSIVDQRAIPDDTPSLNEALAGSALRTATVIGTTTPIDGAVFESLINIALAGHLVVVAVPGSTVIGALEALITGASVDRQPIIRARLAHALIGASCQVLLPRSTGGSIPAVEVLVATSAARALIRDGRFNQLDQVLETGLDLGMISLDRALSQLVATNEVRAEDAQLFAVDPSRMQQLNRQVIPSS